MKTPKRAKGRVVACGQHIQHANVMCCENGRRVRVVELRKGEVIVDVEALVAEFTDRWENSDPSGAYDALRAALRKVGKR